MGREPPNAGCTMCDPEALLIGQTQTGGRPHGKKRANRIGDGIRNEIIL